MKSTSKSFHPSYGIIRFFVGVFWGVNNGSYSRNQATRHFISGESISEIAKSLKLSRPTVRKALKAETEPVYQRQVQPTPKLGDFKGQLTDWLELDSKLPKRRRRTAQRLFECLQVEGYQGVRFKLMCSNLSYPPEEA